MPVARGAHQCIAPPRLHAYACLVYAAFTFLLLYARPALCLRFIQICSHLGAIAVRLARLLYSARTKESLQVFMAEQLTKNMVSQSLFRAMASKRPPMGLIVHLDRGSQYCSLEHRRLLAQFGMVASMNGKGNCYGKASMECFWGMLKNELVHHRRYATRQEAIRDISEYIEIFYNRQRRQSRWNYLSSAVFVKCFYEKEAAA